MVSYIFVIFILIFLTFTCCQFGMPSSVFSYSPSYICMLYVKSSIFPRHLHQSECDIYFRIGVLKYITFTFDVKYIVFFNLSRLKKRVILVLHREVYRFRGPYKDGLRASLKRYTSPVILHTEWSDPIG